MKIKDFTYFGGTRQLSLQIQHRLIYKKQILEANIRVSLYQIGNLYSFIIPFHLASVNSKTQIFGAINITNFLKTQ